MEKQELRKKVKEKLKQKTPLECSSAGTQILARLRVKLSSVPLQIACFISRFPEIDTNLIIENLFSIGHFVCVPSWNKSGKMWMVPLSDVKEYREVLGKGPNYYYDLYRHHIPMPPNPTTPGHLPIDVCITPGLMFSTRKNVAAGGYTRIGYGFGHYDRYFQEYHSEHRTLPFRIGVSYDEQLTTEQLNDDPHDIHMNCLITPSVTYD